MMRCGSRPIGLASLPRVCQDLDPGHVWGRAGPQRRRAGVIPRSAEPAWLDRVFRLRENGTTTRTELEAGLTTFLTMAYILAVNPMILAEAGVPADGALFATAVAAALGSILMGLLANYPFALAPGMGLNAYFTYVVVLGMGIPWQTALGAVFISGVVFLVLTLGRIRELVVRAIPMGLKLATGAGIGLFIAFIGFRNAGLVVASPATLVTLGPVTSLTAVLGIAGLVLTAALMARGWKSAIIVGIAVTAAAAYLTGVAEAPRAIFSIPNPAATFGALDVRGAIGLGILHVVFVFLFIDLFDTVGTLVGLGQQAGYLTPEGELPRAQRALLADSIATSAGAVLGTSTVTSYIESATGVAEGGRTGLTAVTVGFLFLIAVFFSPLAAAVPAVATAPALIIVGSLMLKSARGAVGRCDGGRACLCDDGRYATDVLERERAGARFRLLSRGEAAFREGGRRSAFWCTYWHIVRTSLCVSRRRVIGSLPESQRRGLIGGNQDEVHRLEVSPVQSPGTAPRLAWVCSEDPPAPGGRRPSCAPGSRDAGMCACPLSRRTIHERESAAHPATSQRRLGGSGQHRTPHAPDHEVCHRCGPRIAGGVRTGGGERDRRYRDGRGPCGRCAADRGAALRAVCSAVAEDLRTSAHATSGHRGYRAPQPLR